MKKTCNKYRPNTGSSQYSLNYKFDSMSAAGKISGTALELIKKYNELAKEAHSNGNYTEMETFRQYAEHYRKIVTDINEKKNFFRSSNSQPAESSESCSPTEEKTEEAPANISPSEINIITASTADKEPKEEKKTVRIPRKTFKIVEIAPVEEKLPVVKKRIYRKKIIDKEQSSSENGECANS